MYLVENHNISMEFIEEHIDKFDKDSIFCSYILNNPNLTFDFVKKYKKYFIKYHKRCLYSCCTFTKLMELFGVDPIYELFDLHNDIYFKKDIFMNYKLFKSYENLSLEWIEQNTNGILKLEYDNECPMFPTWKNISKHPIVTMNFIEKHIDYPWDFCYVSKNPNLTLDFFEKYKNSKVFNCGIDSIPDNQNFSIEWIKRNTDCNWVLSIVSSRKNITIKDLEDNKEIFLESFKNCFGVICNPNLTIEKFLEHQDLLFKNSTYAFCFLCRSPSIKMKDIEEHAELPWDFIEISENQNITIEFIEKNINKIDFKGLSKNKFILENRKYERLRSLNILKQTKKLSIDIERKIVEDYF